MGLMQLNFAGLNKIEASIMRLKEFEPPEGYYLAFGGGKDSVVLYDLALKSGVKFDPHYHIAIDPPELVQFIKQCYPEVKLESGGFNFWDLVVEKGFPLRQKRWCCEYFKEFGGAGRIVLTGVRALESARRRKRRLVDVGVKTRFNAAPKFVVHPIIDWQDKEVWEYIKLYNVLYCPLYDEGFKRLGCVMCPLASVEVRQREMQRFPKIAAAWYRAFERLYESKKDKYSSRWSSAEEMFKWWMGPGVREYENYPCRLFG